MIHESNNFLLDLGIFKSNQKTACDDQYVGTITRKGGEYIAQNANGSDSKFYLLRGSCLKNCQCRKSINYANFKPFNEDNHKIVIILESPHIFEFNIGGQSFSSAPAWGRTGNKFNTQFLLLLNKYISNNQNIFTAGHYDIYFVNAIRYQTSLGLNPIVQNIRNFVFETLWLHYGFDQDLVERLNIIKPDIIIDACTKKLKDKYVHPELKSYSNKNLNVSLLEATQHPSVWGKNTQLK